MKYRVGVRRCLETRPVVDLPHGAQITNVEFAPNGHLAVWFVAPEPQTTTTDQEAE